MRISRLWDVAFVVVLVFGSMAQAQAPIGYWDFNSNAGGTGGLADLAGGDHNATLASGSLSSDVPSQLGGGMSLDLTGGSDYAIVNSFSGGASDADFNVNTLTVSTWIKGWPNGSWEPFVAKRGESGQGWQLRRHGGSSNQTFTLRGHGNDDPQGSIDVQSLANSGWVHVLGTYDGATRRIYANGVLDRVDVESGGINSTNSLVTFGARDNDPTNPGSNIGNHSQIQIDDTAVYDVGLAQNQVRHLANGGAADALPTAEGIVKPILNPETGKYYERHEASQTFDQARVDAGNYQVLGAQGHLATISDGAENAFVDQVASGDAWIGLTDSTGTSSIDGFDYSALGTSEEGNTSGQPPSQPNSGTVSAGQRGSGFAWVTGEPYTYQNWGGGEPNNSGEEDAAQIRSDGMWNDHNAGSSITGTGQSNHSLASIVEFDTTLTDTLTVNQFNGAPGSLFNDNAALDTYIQSNTPDVTAEYFAINFADPQGASSNTFGSDVPFPGDTPGDDDMFAIEAIGQVYIPSDGDYTFGTDSDDNVEVFIDGSSVVSRNCCGDAFGSVNLAEGLHDLRLIFFENGGGADVELFAAAGIHSSFDTGQFELVGDVANGGLALGAPAVIPEPTSLAIWSVLGMLGLGLGVRLHRRQRRK